MKNQAKIPFDGEKTDLFSLSSSTFKQDENVFNLFIPNLYLG